ncbi:MAG: hypothetical protein LUO93_02025 [Methanomicrobiales archaeon]|nr:hypothetical protein [Methanomicrobiales archaeon]
MDIAVTLCQEEKGVYPVFRGRKKRCIFQFEDPGNYAGDEKATRARFYLLRDEITHWIDEFFGEQNSG